MRRQNIIAKGFEGENLLDSNLKADELRTEYILQRHAPHDLCPLHSNESIMDYFSIKNRVVMTQTVLNNATS